MIRNAHGVRRLAWWVVAGVAGARAARRALEPSLRGLTVLITGGSRGLGLLLARQFGERGCKLAICARDLVELERARAELAHSGFEVVALPCDVAKPVEVQRLVDGVLRAYGAIDVLVNNASIIQVGPFADMTPEDFAHAMDVNFWGTFHACTAVMPHMLGRRQGRIVNIASVGGKVAVPHLLPYDCAKFAVVGLSEGLRAELRGEGIRVTTIIPGLMRTGSPVNALFKGKAEEEFTWFSLGDALPFSAMSGRRAARRIARAAAWGEAEVTLSVQAKLLRLAHDLMPGLTSDLLGLANRLLPASGGSLALRRGMELASRAAPSRWTELMNRAARDLNQYGGAARPAPRHAEQVGLDGPRR